MKKPEEIETALTLNKNFLYQWGPYTAISESVVLAEWVQGGEGGCYVTVDGHGQVKRYRMVKIGNEEIGLDQSYRSMVKQGIVISPTDVDLSADFDEVYDRSVAFLRRVVEFPDERQYKLVASYVALTWVYQVFEAIPYLRFQGDFGTGKTTALKAVSQLVYRAVMTGGAITTAPIFRLAQKVKGTFMLDEADYKSSDMESDIIKILNCGYTKGSPVLRMGPRMEPMTYDVFGPKVISGREAFKDSALESRCLTISMTPRTKGLESLGNEDIQREAVEIRNGFLGLRMRGIVQHDKAAETELTRELGKKGWEPRVAQLAYPTLAATPERHKNDVLAMFETVNEDYKSLRKDTVQAQILRAYLSCPNGVCGLAYVKNRLDEDSQKRYSQKSLGAIAAKMGFEKYHMREGSAIRATAGAIERMRYVYHMESMEAVEGGMQASISSCYVEA